MTVHIGADQAKTIGDSHEDSGNQDYNTGKPQQKIEEVMDRHNNEVGIICGLELKNENQRINKCKAKINSGDLEFINKSGTLPTIHDRLNSQKTNKH